MKAGHSNRIYYLHDGLGSVTDICRGSDGAVLQSYEYSENGDKTASTSLKSDKTWVGGLSVNDDVGDSGLYLMGHRHYDPSLGRFLSRDPIGFDGGMNLYSYAGNSPSSQVDPTGLLPPPNPVNWVLKAGQGIQQYKSSQWFRDSRPGQILQNGLRALSDFKNTPLDAPRQTWGEAGNMALDWAEGYGINQMFGPGSSAVSDLRKTSGIQNAIQAYRQKNSDPNREKVAWRDGAASFGPSRFWEATKTNNATLHYVGSCNIDIYPFPLDDRYMLIIVRDTKSLKSLAYHLPVMNRTDPSRAFHNQTQTYMWAERF